MEFIHGTYDKQCNGRIDNGVTPIQFITDCQGHKWEIGGHRCTKPCDKPVSWFIRNDEYDYGYACNEHKLITELG